MPKVYTPIDYVLVKASVPHPENTEYKISLGYEDWGGQKPEHVLKVQMVYDGVVSGRRSPSYPIGTDDYKRVTEAISKLLIKNGVK